MFVVTNKKMVVMISDLHFLLDNKNLILKTKMLLAVTQQC